MKTTQSRRCVPELSQNAGKNAIHDLDAGIEKWLDEDLPNRKPKKRKRSHGQSYRADNGPDTVIVNNKRVKVAWSYPASDAVAKLVER